jgi:hypothetical protein
MGDLSNDPFELMETYGEGKEAAKGIKFDFSNLM